MSYTMYVPVLLNPFFRKETTTEALRAMKADCVLVAIDPASLNADKFRRQLEQVEEVLQYYREEGFGVGIWLWSLWLTDLECRDPEHYVMKQEDGKLRMAETFLNSNTPITSGFLCPTCARAREDMENVIRQLAMLKPDMMLFDDDLDYGTHLRSMGCFCDGHMALLRERIGRDISREELIENLYTESGNAIREAWLSLMGETLENYMAGIRRAVDEVDPSLRFGLCSVMSQWGTDGTNPMRLARALAGNTKPLIRLSGAPYWASHQTWGNRLHHTVEVERMEHAWVASDDFEILTEGDVYPRPRYQVPSIMLENFDMALRAAGVGTGTMKYVMDYTSSGRYEMGYIQRHLRNAPWYEAIERIFSGKQPCGVRVYESMDKMRQADFTDFEDKGGYFADSFFSIAARVLSDNTVATTYTGNSGVGAAFGENARQLPAEALENGLILDLRAAKILMSQGVDVGIAEIGAPLQSDILYFPQEDEYVKSNYGSRSACRLTVKPQAQVLTYALCGDERLPDTFLYENDQKQKFLVLGFDACHTNENRYRNYCMQRMLYGACESLAGKPLPARCAGNPDLYMLCREGDGQLAIGLWNMYADEVLSPVVELGKTYQKAEIIHGSGVLKGNRLELSDIASNGFVMILLSEK